MSWCIVTEHAPNLHARWRSSDENEKSRCEWAVNRTWPGEEAPVRHSLASRGDAALFAKLAHKRFTGGIIAGRKLCFAVLNYAANRRSG